MLHGEKFPGSLWKEPRGSLALDREQEKADALTLEKREKRAVKQRDGRCRWPEKHKCRFGLEAIHIVDASLGGPMDAANMWLGCGWIHRRGPESIHGKQLKVECETPRGAWEKLSFWRKGEDGVFYLVAREVRPGQVEKD